MIEIEKVETNVAVEKAVPPRSVTWRAVIVGIVITYLTAFWVREAEIKAVGVFVSESVPTIPAVESMLLLLLVNHWLRRTRYAFPRGELLFIFFFVTVATTAYNCGVVRIFLAFLTAPFYFMESSNKLAEAQKYIPGWSAVHNLHAIKGFYEGLQGGTIPWGVWVVPVIAWTGFFMALWLAMACMIMLMHRPWIEKEKLGFPLFQLPLELTDIRGERGEGVSAFLRNPVMWIGFSIALFSDGSHILRAVFPFLPAFGKEVTSIPFATAPWNALGAITLHRRPILIGFGYLVSAEISFSIWATFWIERLMAVLMTAMGYRQAGAPYDREQGLGAYIAVALVLIYINRHNLIEIARAAVSSSSPEMRGYRVPFWGFLASACALILFCRLLGMKWWVGALYMGIMLTVALTYARIRAEAGIPLAWLFPYGMQKTMLVSALGTAPLSPGGNPSTLVALATLTFLSYSNTISLAGYQVESLRMGRFVSEKPRRIMIGITFAFLIGIILSFYFHVSTFYHVGANVQSGVYGTGFYGSGGAISEYNNAIVNAATPVPIDRPRVIAGLVGFATVFLLQLLRTHIIGFPFHPLGFAAANAYGHLLWWSFFIVWAVKVTVLRYGGRELYRKTVPGFLGFALGHFFVSGVLWGTLGALGRDIFKRYIVCFG